jgi:cytoskeleton protein RodZ
MAGDTATIGDWLRQTREARGLNLAEIAKETRIPGRHLAAIEDGRWDALPAMPYVVGFVRNYAKYLGLDPDLSVKRLKDETQPMGAADNSFSPEPLDESKLPARGLVMGGIAAAVVAVGAYVGWTYWQQPASPTDDDAVVAEAQVPETQETDAGVNAPPAPVLSESAAPPLSAPPPADPALATATPPTDPAAQAPGVTAAPVTVPPIGAATIPGVAIRATEESWVRVGVPGEKALRIGVLQAGETYQIPAVPGVVLMTGNAGGIEVLIDGRLQPPLGEKGMVARNVPMDRTSLLSRSAAPTVPASPR